MRMTRQVRSEPIPESPLCHGSTAYIVTQNVAFLKSKKITSQVFLFSIDPEEAIFFVSFK